MKMYEGKEPCPGCGRTGEQVARVSKNTLCYDCMEKLKLGDSLAKEKGLERNYYRWDELAVAHVKWYIVSIHDIDAPLRKLFRTLSQFTEQQTAGGRYCLGNQDCVTAADTFVLPKITIEAAMELCDAIKDVSHRLRREEEEYKKRIEREVAEQKNEIYNEGVEHGRNLLFQLNNGEISLDEFSKRIKKY